MEIDNFKKLLISALIAQSALGEQDAEAMYVGKNSKDWDKLPGKFKHLIDRIERAEISDVASGYKLQGKDVVRDKVYRMNDVYDHPELFDQYPDLKDMWVTLNGKTGGTHFPSLNMINIGKDELKNPRTMLHELQHAVQKREGFASGGSERDFLNKADRELRVEKGQMFRQAKAAEEAGEKGKAQMLYSNYENMRDELAYKMYKQLPGEMESRDTAARWLMSPAQRVANPTYSGQGAPLRDTISKMGVAAPVGAVLAEQLAQKRELEKKYGGAVEEPMFDPMTLLAPSKVGGGVANATVDAIMKYLGI